MGEEPDRRLGLLWGACALAGILITPVAGPVARALPPCFFKLIVGNPCPSCGTTRAALALGRLDLPAALAVNPLATLVLLVFVAGGLLAGGLALGGRPLRPPRRPGPRLLAIAGIAVLVNWVYLMWAGA